jgi:hypothetical protein
MLKERKKAVEPKEDVKGQQYLPERHVRLLSRIREFERETECRQ